MGKSNYDHSHSQKLPIKFRTKTKISNRSSCWEILSISALFDFALALFGEKTNALTLALTSEKKRARAHYQKSGALFCALQKKFQLPIIQQFIQILIHKH